jgi:NADH-quinone oxidoreductase subunit L
MMYQAIVFLPIIGAMISGLFGRVLGARPCEIITTSFVGIGAVLSLVAFWQVGLGHQTLKVPLLRWVTSGELDVAWALRIDALTAVMLVVVNLVSALVHLYSIGYISSTCIRSATCTTTTAARGSSAISRCSPSPCWR